MGELVLDRVPDLLHCFAHLTARLADVLLDGSRDTLSGPFGFEVRIVRGLAHLFLDVTLRLFDLPLQLILVHARLLQGRVGNRRASDHRRPLVTQCMRTETWSAGGSGAFTLAENREARRLQRPCGLLGRGRGLLSGFPEDVVEPPAHFPNIARREYRLRTTSDHHRSLLSHAQRRAGGSYRTRDLPRRSRRGAA